LVFLLLVSPIIIQTIDSRHTLAIDIYRKIKYKLY